MKIAIIGAGNVGGALAAKWAKVGHTVVVAGRDLEKTKAKAKADPIGAKAASPTDAVKDADVVVFAVPSASLVEVARGLGDLKGKILIDATNITGPAARTSESPALALAKAVPGAKVVKTFNTAFAQIHAETQGKAEKPSQVLVGDDADAKDSVKVLIEEAGFEPWDAGGLEMVPDLEGFARINISLAYGPGKKGPFFYYFKR
ncbi:MAG: prephenate dehydrogenase/arogenate dehydrogenase family protein [Chloroflexota bacterium]|nr:prephenate dehydrogenase/arogenate dehydrogenase family protein [Chloroflexota bacterium]